jgi:hypothetical protein
LTQIALADNTLGLFLHPLQRRHQYRQQQRDNSNDNQQFDQSESPLSVHGYRPPFELRFPPVLLKFCSSFMYNRISNLP